MKKYIIFLMTFVDTPNKKQKHPHYEHRTAKLDKKNNEFSEKKFHHIRNESTHKNLLKSFARIGMCLNGKNSAQIPSGEIDKACLILINTYEDEQRDLGTGPLNDGYLIGLNHHRHGFKVFYLYNPKSSDFTLFLGYFLQNTTEKLTVFYSGLDAATYGTHEIEFTDGRLSSGIVGNIINRNCNGKAKVIFITDTNNGGSVFDLNFENYPWNKRPSNLISFYVKKEDTLISKDIKRSHGIFTYYFCKIINDCPNITPVRLAERINPSILRFNEFFDFETTSPEIADNPIFSNN